MLNLTFHKVQNSHTQFDDNGNKFQFLMPTAKGHEAKVVISNEGKVLAEYRVPNLSIYLDFVEDFERGKLV